LLRTRLIAVVPVAVALVIAGCGSSKKTTSTAASTPSKASSSSSSGAYGPSSSSPAAPGALITTKHEAKLGTVLAYGPKHMTVYLFEADKGQGSSCTGACAALWPPVTGKPQASGSAMSADLGTVKRPDGTTQVTYKGHPLYRYAKDKDAGDAYGEGIKSFGAGWYALAPSGHKIDLT
jgi:predicted lipoprotein with Yx(FWY)xxD motif